MTAKSQPMAGQPEAADDLIAELAKLMAEDARGEERQPAPAFPVRIPGGDEGPKPMPAPHFDFSQSAAPSPAEAAPAQPEPPTPEPFHFDFGLGGAKETEPAAVVQASAADHDSIADLIAAELSVEPQPAVPGPSEPAPAAAEVPAVPKIETNPEPDRFKIAPVFGLGSAPATVSDDPAREAGPVEPSLPREPAPLAPEDGLGRDPIDEIENLIGRAVRVELDPPVAQAEERPAPSPALRSLATPTLPAAPVERGSEALSGADEAILAAAQATGAQIGWVEAPEPDAPEPAPVIRRRAPRVPRMTRALAGPLVAVTLLLAAGFGLYWVLGLGGNSGPAPLLTADTSPTKETPPAPPESSSSQSVVFNEIDGVVPGAEEQLVSRDQADIGEMAQLPPGDAAEQGLANRKVRTVTVRPDGTIVSGDDSVAGSAILPVARPNVPEVPGAEAASPELLASAEPAAEPAPAAEPVPAVETPSPPVPEPAASVAPVTPGSTVPAVDTSGNPVAGKTAPVPLQRPAGLVAQAAAPTSPINALVDTPVTAAASLPPPPAAAPQAIEVEALPNDAPAYVQLASQRSEAEARATAQNMVSRFGPLFGGANMEVQRVDLGERGIYYRVRVPANSLQEANNICTNVKAAGGDCFTM